VICPQPTRCCCCCSRTAPASRILAEPIQSLVEPAVRWRSSAIARATRCCRWCPAGESQHQPPGNVGATAPERCGGALGWQMPVGFVAARCAALSHAKPLTRETDRWIDTAWSLVRGSLAGWPLVQAICDHVHTTSSSAGRRSAHQNGPRRATRRASASVATSPIWRLFCRCLNISGRYCTAYVGYTGVTPVRSRLIFSGLFRPTSMVVGTPSMPAYNTPRKFGRVADARGPMRPMCFFASFGEARADRFEVSPRALPSTSRLPPHSRVETAFSNSFDPMASVQWLQSGRLNQSG